MNWAQLHEVPDAQKVTHDHVEYTNPAPDPEKECRGCKNLIHPFGQRLRCRSVQSPIAAGAWCVRFDPKGK